MSTLTNDQRRRAVEAINETQNLLARELRYPEHLQKADMVSFYRAHLAKLQRMLAE